jgi:hypothetical protein
MKENWLESDKRLYGKGPQVSFVKYLEYYEYLVPESRKADYEKILEKLGKES